MSACRRSVKLANHLEQTTAVDTLHQRQVEDIYCTPRRCAGSIMQPPVGAKPDGARSTEDLLRLAKDFSDQFFASKRQLNSDAQELCWATVEREIHETGHYELIEEELLFAAKTAWRNSQRCIARIQWQTLKVFDARKVETTQGMFEAILRHLKYAASIDGIPSTMTVFRHRSKPGEDFRIWNAQLIRYAGFRQPDGTIIGDPASADLTDICLRLGWKPEVGQFVVLPVVLSVFGRDPNWYEIPKEYVKEVPLTHPEYPKFAEMGLKWYSVPAVSNMIFDAGGILFPACAFSGCYTNPEIARNMCDSNRYNVMEKLAQEVFDLDTTKIWNLWKDRVFLEVNKAVLHSLQTNNVTVIDHHSASDSFVQHLKNEQKLRGGCPADWVWIVPPIGGSLLSVFHQEMLDYRLTPSFSYQPDAWVGHVFCDSAPKKRHSFKTVGRAVIFMSILMRKIRARRIPVTIVYATETGKSERCAKALFDVFKHGSGFDVRLTVAELCEVQQLFTGKDALMLIVASTFGNGDPPDNGRQFGKNLRELVGGDVSSAIRFSVFGLGSSAYPHFCTFAKELDLSLTQAGAKQLMEIRSGDEVNGQDQSFKKWAEEIWQAACREFGLTGDTSLHVKESLTQGGNLWSSGAYQLTSNPNGVKQAPKDLRTEISKTYHKDVLTCTLKERTNLQSLESPRKTLLIKMKFEEEINYQPGDHIAVFVENDKAVVSELMNRLGVQPNGTPIRVEKMVETATGDDDYQRLPFLPLEAILTAFLDINSPPSQTFMSCLASLASDPSERDRLLTFSQDTGQYENWKRHNWPTLLEVLSEFPSIQLDPTLLLMELPMLQPRFYSISSSPLVRPKEIHITAGILTYETQAGSGPVHYGVASSFLHGASVGQQIFCYLRRSPTFYLPTSDEPPIYLIGAGAGIAPFRAFWQHWEKHKFNKQSSPPDVTLIFGCRNSKHDYLYENEIKLLLDAGIFRNVHLALSREPDLQKTYVQHVIPSISNALVGDITDEDAHVYVCGDVGMAAEVGEAIKDACMSEGMNEGQAAELIEQMRGVGRYHEDIFGNYKASAGL